MTGYRERKAQGLKYRTVQISIHIQYAYRALSNTVIKILIEFLQQAPSPSILPVTIWRVLITQVILELI